MPFFVFFMPEYVPLSKIRLSWHSQLTYLTSFRSVVLNTHKLLSAPAGRYSLVVSAVGYKTVEQTVAIEAGVRQKQNVRVKEDAIQLR